MMKYSFIIPVYNGEEYLDGITKEYLDQAERDWEVLFVDDGSADGSPAYLDCLSRTDPRFKVVRIDHGGVSAARNAGLDKAAGEYILFQDQDDRIDPQLLSLVTNEMGEADLFIYNFMNEGNGRSAPARSEEPFRYGLTDQNRENVLLDHYPAIAGSVWNRVFRRDLIRKYHLRFTDEKIIGNEDILFNLKYLMHCSTIAYTDKIGYHYVMRPGSMSHGTFRDTEHLHRFLQGALDLTDYCKREAASMEILPLVFLYKQMMLGIRSYLGEGGEESMIEFLHERYDLPLLKKSCQAAALRIAEIERIGREGARLAEKLFDQIISGKTGDSEKVFSELLQLSGKKRRVR